MKIKEFLPFFYYTGKIHKLYKEKSGEFLREYNVNMADIGFLHYINQENETTQEFLSKTLSINEATVTRALMRLENKDFITRKTDDEDKRKKIVKLTDKGKTVTEIVIQKQTDFEKKLIEDMDLKDIDEFKNYMELLLNKLE